MMKKLFQTARVYSLIVLLGLSDAVTTKYAIVTGKGAEANPISSPVFNVLGLSLGLLVLQALFIAIMSYVYYMAKNKVNKYNNSYLISFYIILAVKTLVVLSNLFVILR